MLDSQRSVLKDGPSVDDGGNFFDGHEDLSGVGRICEDGIEAFLMEGRDFSFADTICDGDYLCAA